MAATHLTPEPVSGDLTTVDEFVELMRPTGYGVSRSTVRRWIKKYGMRTVRIDRRDYVSRTDLLEAHRDEVPYTPYDD
ncbi:helix-turn-helix domain-containing protein [Streptomyces olivaceiscleroticus]|uniref:DNA-binding protein n=1 Tax=Streptomyces olivaceiscleroticus TaxID=68245 RepID=A0ABP3LML4_9ACTN